MKRLLFALLFFVSSSALAQLAPLPDQERFDEPVEFITQAEGESLQVMIDSLARSIGLTPVVDEVPSTNIIYNIDTAIPFRQVWEIVLSRNNLDYILLENDVVVVGPAASIANLRQEETAAPVAADPADDTIQRFYRVNNDPNEVATIIELAVPGIVVQALPGVSSISVRGTQAQLDQVQATLQEFDRDTDVTVIPLEQRVFRLSNAKAEDLAQVLQDSAILSTEETAGTVEGDDGNNVLVGNASTIENKDFTVVADVRTNSLIVYATPRVLANIAELIPILDVPQRQVNVQVRVQEINTRAANDLGINLNAGLGNFAANILDTGLNFVFDAQRGISGLNIGAVLDTLEEQDLSRRVDDSNLTILDNGTAQLNSGGRIELTFASGGNLISRTLNFGVIIEVTPRISADGRVIMDVAAEVSDVATPLGESEFPNRIDFTERRVTSTVTLEEGQTVLLGGLMQNQFSETVDGIPVLSSIPLVGNLFKQTGVEEENNELLLIITANVLE